MKRALILHYSQAGQTARASELLREGLSSALEVDCVCIASREIFPFPWTMREFFRAFPRCVRGEAPLVEPLNLDWERYDLVILAYQVWFLSPSLPIQGFLQSPCALNLKGKKVLTVVTCRNLWYSASRIVRGRLCDMGAEVLGQVTLCERSPLWASFVTTPRWMLTGRREGFAFFPPAGILEEDFVKFGRAARRLGECWAREARLPEEELISNLDRLSLRLMDQVGRKFFELWAHLLGKVAPRVGLWQDFLLILFRLNLIALIVSLAPCTKMIELWVGNDSKAVK